MARLRDAFTSIEARALLAGETLSVLGDQIARVALAVRVYDRTGSAAATAATYAATMLPSMLGGLALAGIADRYPRRQVMIVADLVRAVLIAAMAWPGLPWPALLGLLITAQFAQAPAAGAHSATLALALGDRLAVGQALRNAALQAANLGGFAAGGLLVAAATPEGGLLVDAATFGVSALIVRLGVPERPAPAAHEPDGLSAAGRGRTGISIIWSDPRLRTLVAAAWLAGVSTVPEGLIAPLVARTTGTPGNDVAVGLLMAAEPVGAVLGGLWLARLPESRQLQLFGPMLIGTNVVLVGFAAQPNIIEAAPLLVISGVCSSYLITALVMFTRLVPDGRRGRGFGVARSGLIAAQGAGIAAGGLVAQRLGAATAIGIAGIVGALLAAGIAVAWSRVAPRAHQSPRAARQRPDSG